MLKNKGKLLKIVKITAAALVVVLTLAISYLPGTPTWDDIYAAAGLRSRTFSDVELLDLTVVFVDVGQGDCALIHTDDTNILIDTGPAGNGRRIKDILTELGVDELDYLIITHQHDDHIGSLNELRKLIKINNEIIPDETTKPAGMTLTEGEIELKFLGPVYQNEDLNNMSLVIKMTYRNISIMFTGDAEEEEEGTLLRTYDAKELKSDVLKVGHHGSESSSTPPFIQAVNPAYAVISVGADNDYGHPSPATLAVLENAEVHRTDLEGTVILTTDGEKILIS